MSPATGTTRRYRMGARARRSEETRRRILDAALKRFLEGSFDEVTLAGIATGAGVTVPTLIAHFGRKEDLFQAAWEVQAAEVIARRDEAGADDPGAALRDLVAHYEEHGDSILHLLTQEDRFPAVRRVTDLGRAYHRDWVERVFAPALDRLGGADREQLAVQLVVATDLLSWKLMRRDIGLSHPRTELAMRATVEALTGG